MNGEAQLWHWVMVTLAVVGLAIVYNAFTGSDQPVSTKQAGLDVTAMVIMGA